MIYLIEVRYLNTSKKGIITLIGILLFVGISNVASASNPYDYSYGDAAAFMGLGLMMCAIVCIVWFVIWILIGIWVYKDAEKRGKSGILWLIIVILLGIIGIIIWLVVRPPIGGEKKEPDRRCPNCGRSIPVDARICPYCNKNFEQ